MKIAVRGTVFLLDAFCAAAMLAAPALADVPADRHAVAVTLGQQIAKFQLHKIYVADFIDSTSSLSGLGVRTDKGCYFSSILSTELAGQSGLTVLNRIDTQTRLEKAQLDPNDLSKPETFAQISKALDADGIVWGVFNQKETGPMTLEISLRQTSSTSSKELFHITYQEASTDQFEALFPASTDETGHAYYFPGLDGVSKANCATCPSVPLPDDAKDKHVQGTMVLSAVFTKDGTLDEARVVHSLQPGLDQVVLEALGKWKITPAQANSLKISVRQTIEISF